MAGRLGPDDPASVRDGGAQGSAEPLGERPAPEVIEAAVISAAHDLVVELADGPVAGGREGGVPRVGLDSELVADLGLDSLCAVELIVRVERATGRPVPDEVLADIHTVGDLVAAVHGGMGPRDAADQLAPRGEDGERSVTDDAVGVRGLGRDGVGRAGVGVRGLGRDGVGRAGVGVRGTGVRGAARRRSLAHRLAGAHALAVFGAVAVVAWPLVAVLPGLERRWAVVRTAGRILFRLTGSRLRVDGLTRLPEHPPYVVVANHASFLDPLVLALVLPPPVTFTAVQGLAGNRVVRHFLRRMDAQLVLPGDRARAAADVAAMTRSVRSGRVLAVFAEGRRSVRAGVEPFHLGAFRVAADAQVAVVPVAIRGTRSIQPVDRVFPHPGPATVIVGDPVATTSTGWTGALQLRRQAREAILHMGGEPDLAPVAPTGQAG